MTVTLNQPFQGYTSGELTGNREGTRYEIRLMSGKLIYLYEDEFTKD